MNRINFTPYSWAKLRFLAQQGKTEITGYGETDPADPRLVVDIHLVKQKCGMASCEMDPLSIADYFNRMDQRGLQPRDYSLLWIHTHPGSSVTPSNTDEENFRDNYRNSDFAMMLIHAQDGSATSCRGWFGVGPTASIEYSVGIDWNVPFRGSDIVGWTAEYKENVTERTYESSIVKGSRSSDYFKDSKGGLWVRTPGHGFRLINPKEESVIIEDTEDFALASSPVGDSSRWFEAPQEQTAEPEVMTAFSSDEALLNFQEFRMTSQEFMDGKVSWGDYLHAFQEAFHRKPTKAERKLAYLARVKNLSPDNSILSAPQNVNPTSGDSNNVGLA